MSHNPWAGLASYQDPAGGSALLFCGRDNESYDLAALVDDNIFCTLYGKSGTGKTSLLNAGMFPRLRAMGYLPLSIRLGMDAMGTTFQQCIVGRLAQVATLETTEAVPLPDDDQDGQWLWAWFARTRFVDTEGKVRFPVLVFDQFEEVFRSRRVEAEALLRQIHFMMDPSHALGDDYDYNFRFLAAIREDDLYLLEDSLDRCYLDEMKKCRYRLRALGYENALSVVLKPGKGLFDPKEASEIAEMVIDMSRNEQDDTISTNLLSLLCSRLYAEKERKNAEYITLEMVGTFMEENPFIQFYNEATAGFHTSERNYIEDNMVDNAGRRNSISELDFRMHVRNADRLLEGNNKILQRTSVGGGGQDYRIELIHDSFCQPLVEIKERRGGQKVIWWMVGGFLLLCGLVALLYSPMNELRHAGEVKLANYHRLQAAHSAQALNEGDYDLAVRLALESISFSRDDDTRHRSLYSYVSESGSALWNAMQHHPSFAYLFAVKEINMDTVTCEVGCFKAINDSVLFDKCIFTRGMWYPYSRIVLDSMVWIKWWDEFEVGGSLIYGYVLGASYNLKGFTPVKYCCNEGDAYVDRLFLKNAKGDVIEVPLPSTHYLIAVADDYYSGQDWTEEEALKYKISIYNDIQHYNAYGFGEIRPVGPEDYE